MKVACSWATLLSFVGPVIGQLTTRYNPVREYSGSTFFDRWTYYGAIDNLTWGDFFISSSGSPSNNRRSGNVTYVDQATAIADKLTFVNSAGNAIIQVDNTTTIVAAPVVNRKSVSRCLIKYVFSFMNLFLFLGPHHNQWFVWPRIPYHTWRCAYALRLFCMCSLLS